MLLLPSVDDSMREQIGSGDSDTDSEDYVDTSDMVPTTTQYVSYLLIASITPLYTSSIQGIINPTGMETFAKEPKLTKLLRELKSTPLLYNKKVHWFFSHVCNGNFAVFGVLCYGITCKWVLFCSIDVYFYWLA